MPESEVHGNPNQRINFYKVLGVSEDATRAEMKASYDRLVLLYGSQEGIDLAGISEDDAKRTMKALNAALQILSDRTARTMYDQFRERRLAQEKYGLVKEPEPDKIGFDGKAALTAYADEFEELSKNPGKTEL